MLQWQNPSGMGDNFPLKACRPILTPYFRHVLARLVWMSLTLGIEYFPFTTKQNVKCHISALDNDRELWLKYVCVDLIIMIHNV